MNLLDEAAGRGRLHRLLAAFWRGGSDAPVDEPLERAAREQGFAAVGPRCARTVDRPYAREIRRLGAHTCAAGGYSLPVLVSPWQEATVLWRWLSTLEQHGVIYVSDASLSRYSPRPSLVQREIPLRWPTFSGGSRRRQGEPIVPGGMVRVASGPGRTRPGRRRRSSMPAPSIVCWMTWRIASPARQANSRRCAWSAGAELGSQLHGRRSSSLAINRPMRRRRAQARCAQWRLAEPRSVELAKKTGAE